MPYGILKCDQVTFTNAGVDQTISVSGIVASISGNITATGTISGNVIRGGTTVSGATVTGNAGQFNTITGNTASFTTVSGTNITGDTGTFASGLFLGNLSAGAFVPIGNTVPTNGVYLPAANNVAVATNGSGRLFIDASGRVGIGISSPGDIATGYGVVHIGGTNGGGVRMGTSTTPYGYVAGSASGVELGTIGSTALNFFTNNQTRATITSAGLVGVGTSSVDAKFHVAGDSADGTQARITGATNQNYQLRWGFDTTNLVGRIQSIHAGTAYKALALNPDGGNVGVGNTAPGEALTVEGKIWVGNTSTEPASTSDRGDITITNDTGPADILFLDRGLAATRIGVDTGDSGNFKFVTDKEFVWRTGGTSYSAFNTGTERLRFDASGRLLVGTSSARGNFFNTTYSSDLQIERSSATSTISVVRNSNDTGDPVIVLGKTRGTAAGANTVVADGDSVGLISFQAADGSNLVQAALIRAQVDGPPGANDMPGRLVFSTTADGASSPTERMRITSTGYLKVSNTGAYNDASSLGIYSELVNNSSGHPALVVSSRATSFGSDVLSQGCFRAANSAWACARWFSGDGSVNGFADTEFLLRGDGNGLCDGAWTGGGADYAEYFEWSDSNPDAEDRRGISVVLDGNKIRKAVVGEDPIGVISGNPSVVGDAAWNKWTGKYLRDEFGTYIQEDYEVTDEDGNTLIQQRRKLNPAYDPEAEYIPREQRPEWDCVGLMGKLRIRKGQITGSRWIKMRDISDSVEEWLVR